MFICDDIVYKILYYTDKNTTKELLKLKKSEDIKIYNMPIIHRCIRKVETISIDRLCNLICRLMAMRREDILESIKTKISPLKQKRILIYYLKSKNPFLESYIKKFCDFSTWNSQLSFAKYTEPNNKTL